jgi:hypothetical protein
MNKPKKMPYKVWVAKSGEAERAAIIVTGVVEPDPEKKTPRQRRLEVYLIGYGREEPMWARYLDLEKNSTNSLLGDDELQDIARDMAIAQHARQGLALVSYTAVEQKARLQLLRRLALHPDRRPALERIEKSTMDFDLINESHEALTYGPIDVTDVI